MWGPEKCMGIHIRIALKYVLVVVLSLPVTVLFAVDIALIIISIGEKGLPFIDQILVGYFLQIIIASFLAAWGAVIYWASSSPSIREATAKTCRAFALAAFLLPIASVVFAITSPEPSDDNLLIADGTLIVFCFIFGGILGLLGWLASDNLSPSSRKDHYDPKAPLW